MTIAKQLIVPITAGANVYPISRGTTASAITVNAPTATWTSGTPLTFDIDLATAGYAFINWDKTLEAWWRFENEGTTAQDWSGNNRTLSLNSDGYVAGCFGGYALNCNNTRYAKRDYSLPPIVIPRAGGLTISFWTNHTDDANHAFFVYLNAGFPSLGSNELIAMWRLAGVPGAMRTYLGAIGGDNTSIAGSFTADGTWQHCAMTLDMATGTVKHYYNGILNDTDVLGAMNCDFPIATAVVGGIGETSVWTVNGAMDEVLIFSRVLSADEITALCDVAAAAKLNANFAVVEDSTHTYEVVHVSDAGAVSRTTETTVLINAP